MATRMTDGSRDGAVDPQQTGQPAGGRRRRDAAATRQELLQAARSRFIRLGYDRTTLRDVAADVGVNLALIKRYFDSKEGLFKAAVASTPAFWAVKASSPETVPPSPRPSAASCRPAPGRNSASTRC